jgi:hypothetical protein
MSRQAGRLLVGVRHSPGRAAALVTVPTEKAHIAGRHFEGGAWLPGALVEERPCFDDARHQHPIPPVHVLARHLGELVPAGDAVPGGDVLVFHPATGRYREGRHRHATGRVAHLCIGARIANDGQFLIHGQSLLIG